MAIVILMFAIGALAAGTAWAAIWWLQREYSKYRNHFHHTAVYGLADFFLFLDPRQLWGVNLLFAVAPSALILLVGGHLFAAAIAALVMLMFPRFLMLWARRRRLRLIDSQLPDFLLALAGALRAGSSLQAALRQLSQHTSKPLVQELGLVLQQQRMGVSFNDALEAFKQRTNTESVGLMVAAIKVAGHTGGGLAETLERISETVRMRLQLMGKVSALTAQGRMQAWVMAGLPALLIVVLHAIDPHTISQLWSSPVGWGILVLVAVLELAGILLVRRIVNIQI